ncbi:MAG TPA: tripartite tricarboxylate transporter TctB family protein [Dongiaceae bacterium]|jgi:hypothetical protein
MDRRTLAVYRDAIVGAALLVFSGVYWLGANAIRVSPLEGSVGAQGLPKGLAYVLAVLSVYMIARNLLAPDVRRSAESAKEKKPFPWRQHIRALWMLIFGACYLLLLPRAGYVVSVMLLMAATSYFLGVRNIGKVVLFAVLGGVFFYILFVLILKIPLPEGMLSGILRD